MHTVHVPLGSCVLQASLYNVTTDGLHTERWGVVVRACGGGGGVVVRACGDGISQFVADESHSPIDTMVVICGAWWPSGWGERTEVLLV